MLLTTTPGAHQAGCATPRARGPRGAKAFKTCQEQSLQLPSKHATWPYSMIRFGLILALSIVTAHQEFHRVFQASRDGDQGFSVSCYAAVGLKECVSPDYTY